MKYIMMVVLLLLFNGCVAKTKSYTSSNKVENVSTEDSFEDEFDEEFEDKKDVSDPFESYNRAMTGYNDDVYIHLLTPISKGYASFMPKPARVGISNFFANLKTPLSSINNLLQLKVKNTASELGRFLINSTVGILGFMDIAKDHMGLEPHVEDFGQTLGYYGVGSGAHVVLPFFGPSNLRDIVSLSVDGYVSPISAGRYSYQIPQNLAETTLIQSGYRVNQNSLHIGEYESFKKDALDFYMFLRDAYEQKRDKEISQ